MLKTPHEFHELIREHFQTDQFTVDFLRGDGSDRQLFRFFLGNQKTIIGVNSSNVIENQNFFYLTKFLADSFLPTPKIYAIHALQTFYLLEDLGPKTLAEQIIVWRKQQQFDLIIKAYQIAIENLIKLHQISIQKNDSFFADRQMTITIYQKDLDYFFHNFIQLEKITHLINDPVLKELENLQKNLSEIATESIVLRDYQARNLMPYQNQIYLIDYQDAMIGSIYYDLASLLYAAQSGLTDQERHDLILFFYHKSQLQISFENFMTYLGWFILIRRMRSLGTYSFLTRKKNKKYFYSFIQPSIQQILSIMKTYSLEYDYPCLKTLFITLQNKIFSL